jgi:CRISPR system Cascade subunit CasA
VDADPCSLLTAPLIRAVIRGAVVCLTLPQLLAALMRDEVDALPALRPHQRHAVHMFLAQIAALALRTAQRTEPPEDADTWHALLLALALEQGAAAWSLVVEDVTQPALLQPPASEGQLSIFRNVITTPDALDVLITAKNFDLKSAIAIEAEPDDWLFALISLQTMEGFLGAGNYGIARMNGGFSSRAFLGLAPRGGLGAHLRRDLRAMLAQRDALLELYTQYPLDGGLALTWLKPWDGTTSLSIDQLDLWFVEICRRVRLCRRPDGRLEARSIGTAVARIDAKALQGVTGDFWAPVNDAEGKAFSLDARGFSTAVLNRLLFVSQGSVAFRLAPALEPLPDEQEMLLVGRGVTRGQGKTEGFHERIIPFAGAALEALGDAEGRQHLGHLADRQQKEVAAIARALRFACAIVAANGGDPSKDDYDAGEPFLRRLDLEAEAGFFAALQDRFNQGEAAKAPYLRRLVQAAETLLQEAAGSIPCASIHRPRSRARAEAAFGGTLWGPKSDLVNDKALIMEIAHAS